MNKNDSHHENTTDKRDKLSILLIDDDQTRASELIAALENSRYQVNHLVSSGASLLKQVDDLKPDMVVIDIESPDRDILDSLHTLSNFNPKPIVMFSEQEDADIITRSVKSGVSAYVCGNADPKRVRAILDAALARFEDYQSVKQELVNTKQELEATKIIDTAKRLLMKSRNMSENEAFHALRKMAMDTGQKIEQVAKTLISVLNTIK
ncbi:ANTAR domain-containing response regulator [Brumicola pallidula]|jgi:response regulator NasT|uniref:Response regulator NasT n=1 Tax=Brumicola pallidula DSM 14239 = ACAM 615 TaxID=1121922 RepID=K6ZNY6_9ALTE|nr:ANTAR domain-containing protein [Glaciecola pallidula]GAC30603.1 response regulator NasT [Glaciecola pallidula DSM 14239 = ACAM 615]